MNETVHIKVKKESNTKKKLRKKRITSNTSNFTIQFSVFSEVNAFSSYTRNRFLCGKTAVLRAY